jgi:hypothetical protein
VCDWLAGWLRVFVSQAPPACPAAAACMNVPHAAAATFTLCCAPQFGLPSEWVSRLVALDGERRQVLRVRLCLAGSDARRVLRDADLVLAIGGQPISSFNDVERVIVQAAAAAEAAAAAAVSPPGAGARAPGTAGVPGAAAGQQDQEPPPMKRARVAASEGLEQAGLATGMEVDVGQPVAPAVPTAVPAAVPVPAQAQLPEVSLSLTIFRDGEVQEVAVRWVVVLCCCGKGGGCLRPGFDHRVHETRAGAGAGAGAARAWLALRHRLTCAPAGQFPSISSLLSLLPPSDTSPACLLPLPTQLCAAPRLWPAVCAGWGRRMGWALTALCTGVARSCRCVCVVVLVVVVVNVWWWWWWEGRVGGPSPASATQAVPPLDQSSACWPDSAKWGLNAIYRTRAHVFVTSLYRQSVNVPSPLYRLPP